MRKTTSTAIKYIYTNKLTVGWNVFVKTDTLYISSQWQQKKFKNFILSIFLIYVMLQNVEWKLNLQSPCWTPLKSVVIEKFAINGEAFEQAEI